MTLHLSENTHLRLKRAAKKRNTPISKLTEAILDKALARDELADLKQIYQAFEKLEGIAGNDITDASSTIDQVLYGAREHDKAMGNIELRKTGFNADLGRHTELTWRCSSSRRSL